MRLVKQSGLSVRIFRCKVDVQKQACFMKLTGCITDKCSKFITVLRGDIFHINVKSLSIFLMNNFNHISNYCILKIDVRDKPFNLC